MPCSGKKDYQTVINVEVMRAARTLLADDPIIRAVNRKSNGSLHSQIEFLVCHGPPLFFSPKLEKREDTKKLSRINQLGYQITAPKRDKKYYTKKIDVRIPYNIFANSDKNKDSLIIKKSQKIKNFNRDLILLLDLLSYSLNVHILEHYN